ncbi:CaiB/BaiF CoA transferase family protein [Gordonia sp. DT30]|uniref:CaiB/BaiF CoA transferase family protein n=1 Tax=Gordonia sp. DT30 TaxID=3416546 RepID=UPI003CF558A6
MTFSAPAGDNGPSRPLTGYRVIDFSQIVAGPMAAMVLADLGAEVIKVEPPSGDASRQLGSKPDRGYYGMFDTFNRNKKSVVIDLQTDAGHRHALALIDQADVMIESSRVGVMDRLKLGSEAVLERNPYLIYVSITAYGERGPNAQRGGVDVAIQAETGWMSITGEPDGPPTKLGAVPIDAATGHIAAQGALAALLARERGGRGEVVRVSLYDVGCHLHAHDFTDYLTMGWLAKRTGNFPAATTPSGVYQTADGTMVLSAYMPHHWRVALDILDDESLRNDPRFETMKDRVLNRDALLPALQAILKTRTTADWMSRFSAARITSGVVRNTGEAAESDQFAASEMVVDMSDGQRRVRSIRTPARYESFDVPSPIPSPALDADRSTVLADLVSVEPAPEPVE